MSARDDLDDAMSARGDRGDAMSGRDDAEDGRFAAIGRDPRFLRPSRKERTLAIDERFSAALTDRRFSDAPAVDRYGRRVRTAERRAGLRRFYRLDQDSDRVRGGSDRSKTSTSDESETSTPETAKLAEKPEADEPEADELDTDEPDTDESDTDESDTDESDTDEPDTEPVRDRPRDGGLTCGPGLEEDERCDPTRRLAAVNLDWDHIRAVDVYATLASFLPPQSAKILSVSVYPSEFGAQRMAQEEVEGPPPEIFAGQDSSAGSDDDDERIARSLVKEDKGEEFDMHRLRVYQLERLRYFFAVVEFDSVATAKYIFDQCDGAEFEASANFFDLRFVPDDMVFERSPRDEADGIPDDFEPIDFVTDILQHSQVRLTWDETDPRRVASVQKAFSAVDQDDPDFSAYSAYVASGSSDNESVAGTRRQARVKIYKSLLETASDVEDKNEELNPAGEMEAVFNPAESTPAEETNNSTETTIEKYKRKERKRKQTKQEKKLARRATENVLDRQGEEEQKDLGFDDPFFVTAHTKKTISRDTKSKKRKSAEDEAEQAQLELLLADDQHQTQKHFNLSDIKKAEKQRKKKSKRAQDGGEIQEGFQIDLNDQRFDALYENHYFSIDPTNPKFIKTREMTRILAEKRRRSLKQ